MSCRCVVIIKKEIGACNLIASNSGDTATSKFGYDIGAGTELLVFCGD